MWLHTGTVYGLQMDTAGRPTLLGLWRSQVVTLGELLTITIFCELKCSQVQRQLHLGEGNASNSKNLLWKCWAAHIPVVSPGQPRQETSC